ncbi:glycerol-3-phosphate dehydrogenase [Sporomusaceae bacterium BoRhaA]|uniref:NAD(P)/FAD-dependent oxidoreductase n=1 Tax=Pelorhabdus rhamnosifermentans TaxID=2772457 RepID=UPI001C0639CA|nr:NAD(P)/FAD-dependent oxidoreductase [Pelorhabdus rhamnosifermentans]MBU2704146.1 glycerol-3-phosphate dehydrogenase [Pelorhabdus rhamnosifermentans]
MNQVYDVIIIGAGVVGSAVAREFARYRLKVGVLEKELDVCCETSGRNSGVLHGGFTYKTGSLKAKCSVEGNAEFDQVAAELDVPFKRTGKVVVGFTEDDMQSLLRFKAVGDANGVPGLEIIDKGRLAELDSSAGGEFAMYSPSSGILNPFIYTVALAENAKQNGVDFYFGNEVLSVQRKNEIYEIATGESFYKARWVVNCAGLNSAKISSMLGIDGYTIGGFKGEYFVLDKKVGKYLNMPVYPAPGSNGGFATHATPTVDGNVLIGPDSTLVADFEDYGVTPAALKGLIVDGAKMFNHVKREHFIRNFSGIRPKLIDKETKQVLDFVVESRSEAPNVINLVGIESPGITSALPLARRTVALFKDQERLIPNEKFNPRRQGILCFAKQSDAIKKELIEQDPNYGEIICRCETVTKAEILQAIHNCLGVTTVTGIKNRTRAMMGRCQGGYCETRIVQLLQQELHKQETDIVYSRSGSEMFTGKVRI